MLQKITFFLFFLSLSSLIYGDYHIHKYLKPCPDKNSVKTIEGVDFIYMINLDERPEKFAESLKALQDYNINPYRFSAVNGWDFPIEQVAKLGIIFEDGMKIGLKGTFYIPEKKGKETHDIIHEIGKPYFTHQFSRGALGCCLSHLSVLKDAIDSGYETIWVMEDDIDIKNDPHILSRYINDLDVIYGKDNWDILFTDPDTKNKRNEYVPCYSCAPRPNFTPKNPKRFQQRRNINIDLRQIGARYGTYSMIIRRSGMKKIYNFINDYGIFLPIDMEIPLPNDIKLFATKKEIVSHKTNAATDNSCPFYKNKKQ